MKHNLLTTSCPHVDTPFPRMNAAALKGGEGQFQGAVGGSRRLRPDFGLLRQTETPRAQGPQRHLFILFLKLHHKQKEIQDCNTSSLQNDSETFARSVSCLGASRCGQCSSDQVHLQGTCLQRAMSSYKAERTKFR